MKTMQTNPESAAAEAVAWRARALDPIEGPSIWMPVDANHVATLERNGHYEIEPLVPQSALDALRGEVERLRRELTLANGWSDDPKLSARTAVENANALTDIQRERADAAERRVGELEKLMAAARRAIGDHHAPNDCYATGPLTGDAFLDLVQCPACAFLERHAALTGADPT